MPYTHSIDSARGVVYSVASGRVTGDEFIVGTIAIGRDPLFQADMRMLADFTSAETFDVSTERLDQLARVTPFSERSRRAYLAPQDLAFGLGRMFAAFAALKGKGEIQVFRMRAEALAWLNAGLPTDRWVGPDDPPR
jgi:hypothetical protein